MAKTYERIMSTTVGSDAANVTISNIPSNYTDLVLVINGIGGQVGDGSMSIRLNNDTGSNYSDTTMNGNGSSAGSSKRSSVTYMYCGEMSGTASNYPTPMIIALMSYANTNVNKTVLSSWAAPGSLVGRNVGLWRSTAIINSITFDVYGGTGDIKSGTNLSLYGIKSA